MKEMHGHDCVLTIALVFKLFLWRGLSVRFIVGGSRDVL